jgi:hypothetical protein
MSDTDNLDELAAFTAQLRDISHRLANWEEVSEDELTAFHQRKAKLLDQLGEPLL